MSHEFSPAIYKSRDRDLRVGDDDRERVAGILRDQHVAGRIDTDELQDRLDSCYAAKTYGELDALVADLPAQDTARRAPRRRSWRLLALVALVVAAAALTGGRMLWLAFPLFFFVARPLIWRTACHSSPPGRYL